MKKSTPIVIAGFDPSSGAGLTRDVLVFEHFDVEVVSVCTAITYQNNNQFVKVDWLNTQQIIEQLQVLSSEFNFEWVKIGLIENMDTLQTVVNFLHAHNKGVKIIWDPILSASSGFSFHNNLRLTASFLKQFYLLTPNKQEAELLGLLNKNNEISEIISRVLVKTFDSDTDWIIDILKTETETFKLKTPKIEGAKIHGSGCRLSSAIVANLALNTNLKQSVIIAQNYLFKIFEEKK